MSLVNLPGLDSFSMRVQVHLIEDNIAGFGSSTQMGCEGFVEVVA